MPMNRICRRLRVLTAAVLLALYCTAAAAAAEKSGSLTVLLDRQDASPAADIAVRLYRVGEPDGSLTADFRAAAIDPASLLAERDSARNAGILAALAESQTLPGTEIRTDAQGSARFAGLSRGVYLAVCPAGQTLTFPAFLVCIPLSVNGSTSYDVVSRPKAGVSPSPTPTPGPSPDPGGTLPQTGADPLPLLALLAGGCICVILGTADILRSRRDDHE